MDILYTLKSSSASWPSVCGNFEDLSAPCIWMCAGSAAAPELLLGRTFCGTVATGHYLRTWMGPG